MCWRIKANYFKVRLNQIRNEVEILSCFAGPTMNQENTSLAIPPTIIDNPFFRVLCAWRDKDGFDLRFLEYLGFLAQFSQPFWRSQEIRHRFPDSWRIMFHEGPYRVSASSIVPLNFGGSSASNPNPDAYSARTRSSSSLVSSGESGAVANSINCFSS